MKDQKPLQIKWTQASTSLKSDPLKSSFSRRSQQILKRDVTKDRSETEAILDDLKKNGIMVDRPTKRSSCPQYRPCPFFSCRFNLFLYVRSTGSITFRKDGSDVYDLTNSCALDDISDIPEGLALSKIGERFNLTRERVRQIQMRAIENFSKGEED